MQLSIVNLLVLFVLLVSIGDAIYTYPGTHMNSVASHPDFHEHVHNHTALYICQSRKEEIKEASEQATTCAKEYVPKKQTWCHFMTNNFTTCMKPLVKEVSECFPAKSKDVPQFIIEEVISVTNYICRAKGKDLLELTNPCIHHSMDWETNKCFVRILEQLHVYQKEQPTKEELCAFLQEIRVCVKEHLDASCRSQITRNDFLKLYDSLLVECKPALTADR